MSNITISVASSVRRAIRNQRIAGWSVSITGLTRDLAYLGGGLVAFEGQADYIALLGALAVLTAMLFNTISPLHEEITILVSNVSLIEQLNRRASAHPTIVHILQALERFGQQGVRIRPTYEPGRTLGHSHLSDQAGAVSEALRSFMREHGSLPYAHLFEEQRFSNLNAINDWLHANAGAR